MAAQIIKFAKARKAKTRVDKEQQAIANRARFGRTKAERVKEAANEKLAAQRLEAMKLSRSARLLRGHDTEGEEE